MILWEDAPRAGLALTRKKCAPEWEESLPAEERTGEEERERAQEREKEGGKKDTERIERQEMGRECARGSIYNKSPAAARRYLRESERVEHGLVKKAGDSA